MWAVWAEDTSTHHKTRKSNFDRFYIFHNRYMRNPFSFYRREGIEGEALEKKKIQKRWRKKFWKRNFRKKILEKKCYAWNEEFVFQIFGNIQNGVLQCFINCLLLPMRIRTDAPGLRCYIVLVYSPIVSEEWELHKSLLSYMSQVYALLITLPFLDEICP